MLFLELVLSLEADRLNSSSAFDDCTILVRKDKNEKLRFIDFKKNESICLQGSYIIGRNSTIYMQGAFQAQNDVGNWTWNLSSVIRNPFTLLGSYNDQLNDYLDPVGKLTCDDEKCRIQILEVYPSYNYTKTKVDPNGVVTKITKIKRNTFNFQKNGTTKLIARKTHNKLDEMFFEDVIEISSAIFAFPESQKVFQVKAGGSTINSSISNEIIDSSNMTKEISSSKYVEYSINFPKEEESGETYNKTSFITWMDIKSSLDDSTAPEFMFPEINGELSLSAGVYTIDSISKSSDKPSYWEIALISTGCILFAIVIVLSVYLVASRRISQNNSSTPSGIQVFDHANDPRDDLLQEYL